MTLFPTLYITIPVTYFITGSLFCQSLLFSGILQFSLDL